MAMEFLPAAAREAVPWKNGGGTTREVAARRAGEAGSLGSAGPGASGTSGTSAAFADFDWRISMADVAEDGPFSSFDGYDRIITVLRGPGMVLTVDGVEHRIDAPFEPFAFSGGSTTDCRLLGGPLLDFNVMTRSGRVAASVEILRPTEAAGHSVTADESETVVLVVFQGRAVVEGTELGSLDAVTFPAGAKAHVAAVPSDAATVVGVVRLRA